MGALGIPHNPDLDLDFEPDLDFEADINCQHMNNGDSEHLTILLTTRRRMDAFLTAREIVERQVK